MSKNASYMFTILKTTYHLLWQSTSAINLPKKNIKPKALKHINVILQSTSMIFINQPSLPFTLIEKTKTNDTNR